MKELSIRGWMKSGHQALRSQFTERLRDDSFPASECEPMTPESIEPVAVPTHVRILAGRPSSECAPVNKEKLAA